MTPFGIWLHSHGISYADAARCLEVSRQYVHAMATGTMTPRLKTVGAAIEAWTRQVDPEDPITVVSWFERKYMAR